MTEEDPTCSRCGRPKSAHGVDQMTLEPTKCPVLRDESPPRPRHDY